MKYLLLQNGDKMPAVGLGTWKSSKGEVYNVIREAIKVGYRHFDCAHLYGNEAEIGDAFSNAFSAGDVKREDLWVTSKLWNNRHRAEQVEEALKESLKNLKLDYLDLYLIHWPIALKDHVNFPEKASDMVSLEETPLSETWKGMIKAKESNLAKNIGVSNFNISQIEGIISKTGEMPTMNQVEMHLFLQQNKLKTYCDEKGILLTAYCPLGSGDRPAIRISANEPKLFENETIKGISQKLNITAAQLMLAWGIQRGTSVIPKTVSSHRLTENLRAADIEIPEEEMEVLNNLNKDYRYVKGDFWCLEGTDYTLESLWG